MKKSISSKINLPDFEQQKIIISKEQASQIKGGYGQTADPDG